MALAWGHRAALRASWQAPVHVRGCAADRARGRAAAPRGGLRQGRRAGPQRGTRPARPGSARRHRRPAADADVQGAVAGDGRVRAAHAAGPEDADPRLAAPNHRLSHAAAEWKADLTQRLTAAHVQLDWTFESDADVLLSVVQWSALTRVLRELVSNAIAHAKATRVEVTLLHRKDRLDLQVVDNGEGRNPRARSHGLGLGGVRKRVKQLGVRSSGANCSRAASAAG
ncbi:hypothetical protein FSC37_09065 [Piscinibacter aquaticus]|uniref:histidine kinase n=1 Tax=Piscinibacter aquaticus TaxID=392597 RepID=A0A5C6TZ52_9BURK|nr:hypothetical protein FSC37_09065 [Piscinibacter aquaticus]